MENTKVVVMSANDVAAMRKAHKEAEAAYYQAKVGALEFVAQEMRRTGEEYTAAELAHMTGLSSNEIARQLSGVYARASSEAGIGHVNTGIRRLETAMCASCPMVTLTLIASSPLSASRLFTRCLAKPSADN